MPENDALRINEINRNIEGKDESFHLSTLEKFHDALERHPELEFRKKFGEAYQKAREFYERGLDEQPPSLVKELDGLETRRLYEEANGGPPKVEIESMDDAEQLLQKYPFERERKNFLDQYQAAKIYFEVKTDFTKLQRELADEYGVSQQKVSEYQREIEATLISNLRRHEETTIIYEWARAELRQYLENEEKLERKGVKNIQEGTDLPSGTSICRIESSKVKEHLERCLEKQSIDEFIVGLGEISRELDASEAKIGYIDLSARSSDPERLSRLTKTVGMNREAIEVSIREQVGLEPSDRSIRIGIVENRVYIWKPNLTPNDMINPWGNQYFYFNRSDLARIILNVGNHLETEQDGYGILEHLNGLIHQVISEQNSNQISLKEDVTRILGENLHLICDMTGKSPRDYERYILKVAGINGQGGIENPKILNGLALEEARADFVATILSDCTLDSEGRLKYYEGNIDRIDMVSQELRKFGDVALNIRYLERNHCHEIIIPRTLGKAALYWELPHGDKTIQNPELPAIIENAPLVALRKYLGGLVPEEGNVSDRVSWNRSNAVHAGNKSGEYTFVSKISQEEIELIISEGRRDPKGLEGAICLRWTDIDGIIEANTPTSITAEKLRRTFLENPNNLIRGESAIAKKFGIQTRVVPEIISFYEKTGRVSVKWRAVTVGIKNTVRWGILCPPNDTKKKERMRAILQKRQDVVEEVCKDLNEHGLDYDKWWVEGDE